MTDRDFDGVAGALFVAAGLAVVGLGAVFAFTPERSASAPTPPPLTAEYESLAAEDDETHVPEKAEGSEDEEAAENTRRQPTNRNERAKGMFRGWGR